MEIIEVFTEESIPVLTGQFYFIFEMMLNQLMGDLSLLSSLITA